MPSAHAVYGSFLLRTKRACDAITPLQKAVSLDFFYSYSHFDLANALQECGHQEMARRQAAVTLMTNPSFAYASAWRAKPEFLRAALTQASEWLVRWNRFSDRHEVRLLSDFFDARLLKTGGTETVSAHLTFSDFVATELSDDPVGEAHLADQCSYLGRDLRPFPGRACGSSIANRDGSRGGAKPVRSRVGRSRGPVATRATAETAKSRRIDRRVVTGVALRDAAATRPAADAERRSRLAVRPGSGGSTAARSTEESRCHA